MNYYLACEHSRLSLLLAIGMFHGRDICNSALKIPYWWHESMYVINLVYYNFWSQWRIKWSHAASNFIVLIPSRSIGQMLAVFSGVEFWRLYWSSGKEKESYCLVFTSCTKCKIRHFHIVVVQWRQRNVEKGVTRMQSCCFANLILLLFCRSCWRHLRRCLSPLMIHEQILCTLFFLIWSPWMKSYGMTIQLKPFWQYFHMALFI